MLEVGCGTGNYIRALAARFGCTPFGLDPSQGMLDHARSQSDGVAWVQGRAEQLGFTQDSFDLIFSVDAIHHLADKVAFYDEAIRMLRPGGLVYTVTDSQEIIRRCELLSGYFPETVKVELARCPRLGQMEVWMTEAGFSDFAVRTVEESHTADCAQPFRDKAYSSLHLIPESAWPAGLERLERDLARRPIRGMSRYACVSGRKPYRRM